MKEKNKFYEEEIKLKAIEMKSAGVLVKEIVEKLGIKSESQVYTWWYWFKKGDLQRLKQPIGKQYSYYLQNLKQNEWYVAFGMSHVLTKYLVYSNYLVEGNLDLFQDANSFFENYIAKTYDFEDLKKHVQYFLYQ